MSNNTSIIAQALAQGLTIRNKTAAKLTGDKIGVDNYAMWTAAMENARLSFYAYWFAKDYNAKLEANGKDTKDIQNQKDAAHKALVSLLTIIGEVNGHPLRKSNDMLDTLLHLSTKNKDALAGEAELVASQIKNYKSQLKDGGNDDFIADIEEKLTAAEEKLRLLKKTVGSSKVDDGRASYASFCKAVERELAKYVTMQLSKTPEELDKEEAERKAKSKANAKANRQRKRAAAKATATESK